MVLNIYPQFILMTTRLFDILRDSCAVFREKASTEIREGSYKISSPNDEKNVQVNKSQIRSALNILCPKKSIFSKRIFYITLTPFEIIFHFVVHLNHSVQHGISAQRP